LAACSTANRTISSDGIVGLTRSFFVARARFIIASLWPVDDEFTCSIMKEFYQLLANSPEKDPAVLLNQVVRKMSHLEPSLWAPFICLP